jgi:rRNA-processing protein FCF1
MDTNALMMPVELDVRLFEELDRTVGAYDLVTPAAVVAELERLSEGAGEAARAASVGRDLAARCRVVETDASYADDAVVELVERGEADCVVTNDEPLQARVAAAGARVIGIRGRNTLTIHD